MMKMIKTLNKNGLLKILPLLEQIAEEKYGDHGGLNIFIIDNNLKIDAKMPKLLVNELKDLGVGLEYLGKDGANRYSYDVLVELGEVATPTEYPDPAQVGQAGQDKAVQMAAEREQQLRKDLEAERKEEARKRWEQFLTRFKELGQEFGDIEAPDI
jgi:hypothetical protein